MWFFYLFCVIEMEDLDEQILNEIGYLVSLLFIFYLNDLIFYVYLRFTCYFKDEYRLL